MNEALIEHLYKVGTSLEEGEFSDERDVPEAKLALLDHQSMVEEKRNERFTSYEIMRYLIRSCEYEGDNFNKKSFSHNIFDFIYLLGAEGSAKGVEEINQLVKIGKKFMSKFGYVIPKERP